MRITLARTTIHPDAIAALQAGDTSALIAHHRRTFGGYVMEDGADTGADTSSDDTSTDADAGADADLEADKDETDPRVKRANTQAARYRTELRAEQAARAELEAATKANAATLEALRKALDPNAKDDGETDPAKLLADATAQAQTLQGRVTELEGHLLVHTLAGDHAANPVALLDSRSFTNTLAALDAAAGDYETKVAEAIKEAVAKNSTLRAGQGSSRGGSEAAGGAGPDGTVTQDQFEQMSYADKAALAQANPTLYRRLSGRG